MDTAQTATNIKDLCKQKGVSISALLSECNIRKSLIYDMEKRNCVPSAEILKKIANYFDVSVDYLLGKTEKKEKPTAVINDELWEKICNDPKKREIVELILTAEPDDLDKIEKIILAVTEE